ncbi:hypothetical protein TNCV_934301 [Trichonephila clavipes]|nr:hypothetical protein TNCV_934301 [Trichonephila clavipes]
MKSLVFETPVNSAEELVARISAAAGEIRNTPEMLSNVRRSMKRRCEACITCGGRPNSRHWSAPYSIWMRCGVEKATIDRLPLIVAYRLPTVCKKPTCSSCTSYLSGAD